jgi:LuxR family transcriptional regulator, maltose regulon positive regulatory protein
MVEAAAPPEHGSFPAHFVSRRRLVNKFLNPDGPPIAVVAAPAGYGRTTVLAEWARSDPRGVAWITLDESHDHDPARLARAIADVLGGPGPFALVLDDVHVLHSKESLRVVRELVERVPRGSRVALSSRTLPPLPIGRLRAQRRLIEIDAHDLAMTTAEAAQLLGEEGLRIPASEVEALVVRTDGWAAALYLAAFSSRDRGVSPHRFGGDDITMRQYLADSVLADLSPRMISLLARTSVVDRLSGGLCDAILDAEGSGRALEELATRWHLLEPLDRSGDWYRCRTVLRQMLISEFHRRDPAGEQRSRRRARGWLAAHGEPERAADQAVATGDVSEAGKLLWAHGPQALAAGRAGVVRRWLGDLGDERIAADSRLAVLATATALTDGAVGAAQRWLSVAGGAPKGAPEVDAVTSLFRTVVDARRLRSAMRGAAAARDCLPKDRPWYATACFVEGAARHLSGDFDSAESVLEDGARRGAVTAHAAHALCLAQLGLLALDRGDAAGAAAPVARARRAVEGGDLRNYSMSTLVFAVSSSVRARQGRLDEAQADARQCMRLLDGATEFTPWFKAQVRLALAQALTKLGEVPTARSLIDAARRDVRRVSDSKVLRARLAAADRDLSAAATAMLPAESTLTNAELRILRFLPTHLSFREIADDLFVSANTVKTQAHAVYRKLGASSRSEAVARASELGLLDV